MTEQSTTQATTTSEPSAPPKGDSLLENIKTIIFALTIAFVLRVFLFQPFNIPTESMRPGLVVGDYLWTSKWDYGFSRMSIPFEPKLFKGRILGQVPERGDVVVFKLPRDNKTDYIKRLIGFPGDRIQVVGGQLVINGTPVQHELIEPETIIEQGSGGVETLVQRFRETLPNGRTYVTYDKTPVGDFDNTQVFVVPEEHYFMMGDNRDNSSDSRADPILQGGVGFVPAENLVGRGRIVLLSFDETTKIYLPWTWFTGLRWDRLAVPIR
jgi:signal peptidase I